MLAAVTTASIEGVFESCTRSASPSFDLGVRAGGFAARQMRGTIQDVEHPDLGVCEAQSEDSTRRGIATDGAQPAIPTDAVASPETS